MTGYPGGTGLHKSLDFLHNGYLIIISITYLIFNYLSYTLVISPCHLINNSKILFNGFVKHDINSILYPSLLQAQLVQSDR